MFIFIKYFCLILLSFSVIGKDSNINENYIVKQGEIEITFKDIDGYAQSIPEEDREGFFSSMQRIDKTVTTLLNIKTIVAYGKENKFINKDAVNKLVKSKSYNFKFNDENNSVLQNNNYLLYKNYLTLKESYTNFQEYFKSQINRDNLSEMAQEMYLIDKSKYMAKESRDFSFVAIKSNINDATLLLNQIIETVSQGENFMSMAKIQKEKNPNLEISKEYYNFELNNKHKEFSDYIYSTNRLGIIDTILEIPPKLYLANITKINKPKALNFDIVKDKIIDGIVMTIYERDFQNLLSQLTKENVKVNEDNLKSLQTRYSK